MPLEAVDLLFADRNGQRPSILRVVRDSRDKAFVAGIEQTLQERAMLRADNVAVLEADKMGDAARFDGLDHGLKA